MIKTSNQQFGVRCANPKAEAQEVFKRQSKMIHLKVKNSTIMNFNDSRWNPKELKKVRMMNEIKEDTNKHLHKFKDSAIK